MKVQAAAYQRQATAATDEARSRAGSAASTGSSTPFSTAGTASAAPSAKITTTSFGFSLGKFGLRFTQDEVSLSPDPASQSAADRLSRFRATQRAQSFASDLEVQTEYQTLHEPQAASASDSTNASAQAAEPLTATQRRYGLAAYAKAVSGEEEGSMGWGLGVV